jgi:G:T-mismatch repair DNA endonuclease (very short patch repair protein)
MNQCKCGCGGFCKGEYIYGHNRRGRVLSEIQREKMSNSHKGHTYSEESKLKMSNTRKILIKEGKLFSKETREKMRKNRLGKHLSEQAKQKLRNLIISKETREKISKAGIGRIFSKESKDKISLAHKGMKFTEEHKLKLKLHRAKMILPTKNSSIEVKIQNFLTELHIDFLTHCYMKEIEHGYQCDILIPSMNLIIECDGDYWHKYPTGREIDHIRTEELTEQGFIVLRLWEREIRVMKLNDFKDILESINGH